MASFNKCVLMGNLTADPELKQTTNGTSVCSFSIGVQRKYSKDNNGQQNTDFLNIVAWRQTAEFVSRYFKKGSSIVVCGQIQVRQWQDQNGQKRYATEIQAEEVTFGASASQNGSNSSHSENKPSQGSNYIPNAYLSPTTPKFEDIPTDEQLPF